VVARRESGRPGRHNGPTVHSYQRARNCHAYQEAHRSRGENHRLTWERTLCLHVHYE